MAAGKKKTTGKKVSKKMAALNARKKALKKDIAASKRKLPPGQPRYIAPKGNKFWMARSSHGRNPIFATADDLLTACIEFFNWVEANPLYEARLVSYLGYSSIVDVPKMRAMTIEGLCIFLDITQTTWFTYRQLPEEGDSEKVAQRKRSFSKVAAYVENVIRTQKFTGAAADFLNANIIARDLGLRDKSEFSGPEGGPIENKFIVEVVEGKKG